jgi:hypothetical protein
MIVINSFAMLIGFMKGGKGIDSIIGLERCGLGTWILNIFMFIGGLGI